MSNLPTVKHAYSGHDPLEYAISSTLPSRTKQSFRDECDINIIMGRYLQTGVIDFVAKHSPQYGDVTGADFQTAMQTVAQANSMFADLPSSLRERFGNDPAQFLDFVADDKNRAEAAQLGLLSKEAQQAIKNAAQAANAASPTPTPTNEPKAA